MSGEIENKQDKNNPLAKELLVFITETKDGKYTSQIPIVSNVSFRRITIQEQDESIPTENPSEEAILYGISY